MKKSLHIPSQFVVCIKNTGYRASLELHKIYRIVPDEDAAVDGDIRVVDESGEDYLYPAAYFAGNQSAQRSREVRCSAQGKKRYSTFHGLADNAIIEPGM